MSLRHNQVLRTSLQILLPIAVLGGAVAVVSLAGLEQRPALSQKAGDRAAANLPAPAGREDPDADLAMQRSGDGRRSWSYVIAARELLEDVSACCGIAMAMVSTMLRRSFWMTFPFPPA